MIGFVPSASDVTRWYSQLPTAILGAGVNYDKVLDDVNCDTIPGYHAAADDNLHFVVPVRHAEDYLIFHTQCNFTFIQLAAVNDISASVELADAVLTNDGPANVVLGAACANVDQAKPNALGAFDA